MSTSHFALSPNTTVRRYSLVLDAHTRVLDALEAYRAAGEAYLKDKNLITEDRLLKCTENKCQAEADYKTVTGKVFPADLPNARTADENVQPS